MVVQKITYAWHILMRAAALALVPLLACTLYLIPTAWAEDDLNMRPSSREVSIGYILPEGGSYDTIEIHHYYAAYLAELRKHLNWTYNMVPLSVQDGFRELSSGRVELLLPVAMTPQRQAEGYVFSKSPAYRSLLALYTRKGEKHFSDTDFTTMDGASVGLYEDKDCQESFAAFCQRNNLTTFQVHTYADQRAMLEALTTGEVDLAVDAATCAAPQENFLLAIDSIPGYIISRKDNSQLIAELDLAAETLQRENPEYMPLFQHDAMTGLRPFLTHFTPEEAAYIHACSPLRVVFFNYHPPYITYQSATDEIGGIYPDLFRLLGKHSGISFTFQQVPSYDEAVRLLQEGQADLMIDSYSAHLQNGSKLFFSNTIYKQNCVFISRRDRDLSIADNMPHTAVMVGSTSPGAYTYIANELPNWQIKTKLTISSCFEAVNKGEADFAIIDILNLQSSRVLLLYPDLSITPGASLNVPVTIICSARQPRMLQAVLNKAILRLDADEVSKSVIRNGLATAPHLSMSYLLYHYPIQIGLVAGLILLLAAIIIFSVLRNRDERRQRELLAQKNQTLEEAFTALQDANAARDAYKEQAETDELTGLLNKAAIGNFVRRALKKVSKDRPDALIIIDLDHFKEANDTRGHQYGDDILRDFAHALIRLTRHGDGVGRFGGDEFLIYLRNMPKEALNDFAERVRAAAHNLDPAQHPPLSASIGIAVASMPGLSYEHLFQLADRALYKVKANGRDGYQIYKN